jgi:hypothetical protein
VKANVMAALWVSFILDCFLTSAFADPGGAISEPGIFVSKPGEVCTAALKTSPQGGFKQLFIGRDRNHLTHVADDVTAIIWATPKSLVYSASPIYGKPGVFLVTCTSQPTISTLVAPEHKDRAYPQGSDYFEVQSINGHEVRYRYGADVDQIDFTSWHSAENFRTAQIPTE